MKKERGPVSCPTRRKRQKTQTKAQPHPLTAEVKKHKEKKSFWSRCCNAEWSAESLRGHLKQ